MEMRLLNPQGLKAFENHLREKGNTPDISVPLHLLEEPELTEPAGIDVDLEPREFTSRLEMARYLVSTIGLDNLKRLGRNPGLYSWLALYYLEQLCPPGTKPRQLYKYVVHGDESYKTYYRHLVYGPCSLFILHGEGARLLLSGQVSVHPDVAEQFASRDEVVTSSVMMSVADTLYFDDAAGRPKPRTTDRHVPGNIRRLIAMMQQFDVTYDIYDMATEDLLNLLPVEFSTWKAAVPA